MVLKLADIGKVGYLRRGGHVTTIDRGAAPSLWRNLKRIIDAYKH